MTAVVLLGYEQISVLVHIPVGTLRAWKARGKMPEPDYIILNGNPVPGWTTLTINEWITELHRDGD